MCVAHPVQPGTAMRRPIIVLSLAAAIAWACPARTAGAICYRQPFDNPDLEDGWGSTLPPRTNPHRGVDYPQAAGTPIPAIADGVVVTNTWSDCLGNVVVLRHDDGMYSGYNHMITGSPLGVGAVVAAGDTVGQVGDTGTCSFGAHLHLTVAPEQDGNFYGTTVDPYPFIEERSESSDTCQLDRLLEQTDAYAGPRTTDVDGDGRADLCARDSAGFRCWVARAGGWDPPWAPIPWSDDAGWSDVANYATLRMGDLDGDGRADVCGRSDGELLCALSTGGGFAEPTVWRPEMSDANGWGLPQYYTTLRLADVDGDGRDDLCARDSAGFGCWLSDGVAFSTRVEGPTWDDAGFISPRHHGTLRMGDLDGDGRADACIRGAGGVECVRSDGTSFSGVVAGPAWSDEGGWGGIGYWSTMRLADVDGDGRDDLCARSASDLRCVLATADGFGETLIVDALSDDNGWGDRANYASLRTGDIDGDGATDLCARADAGMGCWTWDGTAFLQRTGPAWSDDQGWAAGARYYQAIRLADFDGDGRSDLCARGGTGWRCAPSTGDAFGAEVTIDDLTDAAGWIAPRYWSTIASAGPVTHHDTDDAGDEPAGDAPMASGCSATGDAPTWPALALLALIALLGRVTLPHRALCIAMISFLGCGSDSRRADHDAAVPADGRAADAADAPGLLRQPGVFAGQDTTCALHASGVVRCWGSGFHGLGYGNKDDVGDNETPESVGDIDLGGSVAQLAAGKAHICALLASGNVRCWGTGELGRLGYGNTENIGDDETPGSVGDVDVGPGVIQIAAGDAHTCALLSGGTVRCWGFGAGGALGYGDTETIGDDETAASAGDVDVGDTVVQIAAGGDHTCALLTTGRVRCWGFDSTGALGHPDTERVGDDETPASAGDVDVGGTVVQIAAGRHHTCAVLSSGDVRCWGWAMNGRLGYGNLEDIGDGETPASAGSVDLGGAASSIAAGAHTCAILAGGDIRCWGLGDIGQLGHGDTEDIGDDEPPGSVDAVDVGGAALQISCGSAHTCALLADDSIRCWGSGAFGRLGYGDTADIGDNEPPSSIPPVAAF